MIHKASQCSIGILWGESTYLCPRASGERIRKGQPQRSGYVPLGQTLRSKSTHCTFLPRGSGRRQRREDRRRLWMQLIIPRPMPGTNEVILIVLDHGERVPCLVETHSKMISAYRVKSCLLKCTEIDLRLTSFYSQDGDQSAVLRRHRHRTADRCYRHHRCGHTSE